MNSQSLLSLMSIKLVIPSNHLILCHLLQSFSASGSFPMSQYFASVAKVPPLLLIKLCWGTWLRDGQKACLTFFPAKLSFLNVRSEVKLLSCVRLFVTPWTVAYQAAPSMGFSRQVYWSGLPFPSPGDLPDPGIKPESPALQADALPSEPPGKPGSRAGLAGKHSRGCTFLRPTDFKHTHSKAWRGCLASSALSPYSPLTQGVLGQRETSSPA